MKRSIRKIAVVLTAFSVLLFCPYVVRSDENAKMVLSPEQSENQVEIVSITPDASLPLYVGDKADIEIKIDYVLKEPTGSITLVIQKGEMGGSFIDALIASATKVVASGKGTIELKQSIIVPETGAIQVFTPLMVPGSTQTTVADSMVYEVKKK